MRKEKKKTAAVTDMPLTAAFINKINGRNKTKKGPTKGIKTAVKTKKKITDDDLKKLLFDNDDRNCFQENDPLKSDTLNSWAKCFKKKVTPHPRRYLILNFTQD